MSGDRRPPNAVSSPSSSLPEPARLGRRGLALVIDWALCQAIAVGLLGVQMSAGGAQSFVPLGIFALENLLLVGTMGSTIGHRMLGLRVLQVRAGLFPLQVLVRTILVCLFFPAVFTASDGRGFHDVIAGTTIVRV